MRPAFHASATISGYCQGVEYNGSVEHVFEWVDGNGPAPNICPRFARIEIIETIAVVHLEVEHWSGKLAGANARASDVFTLLKCDGEWKITRKPFHWHVRWSSENNPRLQRSPQPSTANLEPDFPRASWRESAYFCSAPRSNRSRKPRSTDLGLTRQEDP